MTARKTKGKLSGSSARKAVVKRSAVVGVKTEGVKPGRTIAAAAKLLSTVLDASARLKERAQALAQIGNNVAGDRDTFKQVVRLVKDTTVNATLRSNALSQLQVATFDPSAFAPYRAAYMTALRSLCRDPDMDIRQRAFGLLAREQDADTQALLLAGLEGTQDALLPPEKALQLLSYDPHAGAYEVARKIEQDPPNTLARREALRVLAADADSVDRFADVLRDKKEPTEVRQIAAGALNHLAPKRMQAIAREMALDDSESDDLRTVGLTALAHFGDPDALTADAQLQAHVQKITEGEVSTGLQAAAEQFKVRCS
ncbi:hypothetical protein ACKZDW_02840 (plasmid) [Ralstonia syzygii subsp. celebesensis]|uniref:HEAT repeat domain-containing protein n=3 Tax=Ralstonia solanacearum species complex TaxID=3116862 RepID=A0AAD0S691_RALSL|nr:MULTISPECIES: hypothetical protein [Ralstonia solanacearum species complex]CCA83235.1 conserved hypothetical protein [blood disease bacterium R229]AQW32344.1 hypothetical protein B0B51_21065 [blood disease bacterium A2-HR MARDI]AXV81316.1 hypothetical protein CJO77_06955 [Ralstonia solanacearum]AXW52453.1 hypothetical protein CJO92_06955 [Ralstonia solanacearum]QQV57825.1 hypothetical protein JK151_20565 [Ralstonia syzygii subsp. celebesensis]